MRFSTVRRLQQTHKEFEAPLQKMERLKQEPEEPAEGSSMEIGGDPLSDDQQWCCDELYALLSRKTKDGPMMIVRNLETLASHVTRGQGLVPPREGSRGADKGKSDRVL